MDKKHIDGRMAAVLDLVARVAMTGDADRTAALAVRMSRVACSQPGLPAGAVEPFDYKRFPAVHRLATVRWLAGLAREQAAREGEPVRERWAKIHRAYRTSPDYDRDVPDVVEAGKWR